MHLTSSYNIMHSAVQYTMQYIIQCITVQNNYCNAVAYHESSFLLQGWWVGPCTALQMWPTLAGRKSGVKAVNCVHDSQDDQIGHLYPAAHHSHSTFSWGTLRQGTAHEVKIISIQCSSSTNTHTQLYSMFKRWTVQNLSLLVYLAPGNPFCMMKPYINASNHG